MRIVSPQKNYISEIECIVLALFLDILLARKAADDSRAAVKSHIHIHVNPSQHQKDWT